MARKRRFKKSGPPGANCAGQGTCPKTPHIIPNSPASPDASTPSFRARHTSFEEIEELLLMKGVTPDIHYGTYMSNPETGAGTGLLAQGGLVDFLSVYGSRSAVDANTAAPAVLVTIGLPPDVVSAPVARRRMAPFTGGTLADSLRAYGVASPRLQLAGVY